MKSLVSSKLSYTYVAVKNGTVCLTVKSLYNKPANYSSDIFLLKSNLSRDTCTLQPSCWLMSDPCQGCAQTF